MGIRYPGRAAIDPSAPQAVGVCDRCGFLYNLRDLRYQPIYAGPNILVTRLRVCWQCWDLPNEQLRTIRIPPDPVPVDDPRPQDFATAEQNFLDLRAPIGKQSMFLARSSVECELTRNPGLIGLINGQSVMDGVITRGIDLPALIDDTSVMDASLTQGVGISALIDDTSVMDAVLDAVTPVAITLTDSLILFTTDSTTPYSASHAIGTAAADRLVFLSIMGSASVPASVITGVTIGGVTATLARRQKDVTSGNTSEIWWAAVPTGTSATIVITTDDTGFFGAFAVHRVTGANTVTPIASSDGAQDSDTDVTISLSPTAGAATLCAALMGLNSTDPTVDWTNITEDYEDYEGTFFGYSVSTAFRRDGIAPGSTNITCTVSSQDILALSILAGVVIAHA